jgi:hypothetical protein
LPLLKHHSLASMSGLAWRQAAARGRLRGAQDSPSELTYDELAVRGIGYGASMIFYLADIMSCFALHTAGSP